MTKTCTKCGETKDISAFSRNHRRKDGRAQWCKVCSNEYLKEYSKRPENRPKVAARMRDFRESRTPEQRRESSRRHGLRRDFNLTPEEYDALLASHEGCCWGCGRLGNNIPNRALVVDHCHTSGRVRGLLCDKCNRAIGLMNDDPVIAQRLAEYLGHQRVISGGGVVT